MRNRFDQNEVNPLPPSTYNNKLCYCKVLFSWLRGGEEGGGYVVVLRCNTEVMGRFNPLF